MAVHNLNLRARVVIARFATVMPMLMMIHVMIVTMMTRRKRRVTLTLPSGQVLAMLDCTLSGEHGMNIRPVATQARAGDMSS